MIITQTPFRMSFFGGGTDMKSFFEKYGVYMVAVIGVILIGVVTTVIVRNKQRSSIK